MKKVAIIGLGWLGMPLALSLMARGYQVLGSKTTEDGVEAAKMCGIESYSLVLQPQMLCDSDALDALFNVDALILTLPARRSGEGDDFYFQAVQQVVDTALAYGVPRIIFTSSTSVYGEGDGVVNEQSPLFPVTASGKTLKALESWLHSLPGTEVDILRLAGLVGPGRHPGRFLANKTHVANGQSGVNLVHLDDVIDALALLLQTPHGGHVYNLSAPEHPIREVFYPQMAKQLGLIPPQFDPHASGGPGKLIDGSLICRELGFAYQYPDPLQMPLQ
ncbi:SDR family oxidoreductase [Citrobacter sp. JGM124]|uniref:SDR family oxidoreductase n=1 Tax=Citrobacter sp. JGM124 TaxID=2799789 RepID=UPI001BAE0B2D|nr:SDR family oxidoreductase [Citrobacter sp. JGM124]MBS0847974.1 SDR family oxidoreductase [Citrobacter sp. JGM124]